MATADTAKCNKCNGSWFEQLRVAQYSINHITAPGQTINSIDQDYVIFRCARCNELFQPNMVPLAGQAKKYYDEFVDELEKPVPTKEVKPVLNEVSPDETPK